ncbi:hypothetical protein Igag_0408 [Ignisphaera aggregans DSM 17230]|uniref:UPF0113 domain-containing protein n=1 Tax=Ignisphaera aggregans (strain DSM 17230 / JCM 13409 / AQ1.S1) TaxID=583356 RepID=E0SRH2_IGNAA|nr:hypothetical protein Igag_0408 [Ignisphaera aggregans DSM 17230]
MNFESVFRYIEKCFGDRFTSFVLSEFSLEVFRNRFVSIVPKNIYGFIKSLSINPILSGIIIGWFRKGEFIPSTNLFYFGKSSGFRFGCSVIAGEQGVKAFLYGNDLLLTSFRGFIEPVEKGMYVAVVDSGDMMPIGIGRLVVDPREVDELRKGGRVLEVIAENIFDLGRLLRDHRLFSIDIH